MSAAAVKLGLLILAFFPLLTHNLRTGEMKNVLVDAMPAVSLAVGYMTFLCVEPL